MKFACIDGSPKLRDLATEYAAEIFGDSGHTFDWIEEQDASPERYRELASRYDGLLVLAFTNKITAAHLEGDFSGVLSYMGTGASRAIDVPAASERGIAVCNVPDYASDSVAEHTIALILAVARQLVAQDQLVRAHKWEARYGIQLTGKQIGVVGAGPIARKVIQRAAGLGMRPVCWTRNPSEERARELGVDFVDLETLFSESDVISLHLAHTDETTGLISAELQDRMKSSAIFVNTARAELVDTHHIGIVLREGRIFGAGLDVYKKEPAKLDPEWMAACPNLVLGTHSGSLADATRGVALKIALQNLRSYGDGTVVNQL